MTRMTLETQGQSDTSWTSVRTPETGFYVSGGLGVVGSNPATPTTPSSDRTSASTPAGRAFLPPAQRILPDTPPFFCNARGSIRRARSAGLGAPIRIMYIMEPKAFAPIGLRARRACRPLCRRIQSRGRGAADRSRAVARAKLHRIPSIAARADRPSLTPPTAQPASAQ